MKKWKNIILFSQNTINLFVLLFFMLVIASQLPIEILAIDLISHFQTYYAAISLAGIILYPIASTISADIDKKHKIKTIFFTLLIIISFITSSSFIFSYPVTNEKPLISEKSFPETQRTLKVMQANVFKFNFKYKPLVAEIKKENPDIIALAEVTPEWKDALLHLKKDWPYIFDHNQKGSHGMMIFSKYLLTDKQIHYFGGKNIPTLFFQVKWNNANTQFVSTHPLPPVCLKCFENRDKTFKEIAKKLKQINITNKIVMGDLNVTMFSPSYKSFIKETNLINARKNIGLYPTWPTTIPAFLRIPIDHIMHSESLKTISFKTLKNVKSDHLPTIAILTTKSQHNQ